jgi:hypothetical protein
MGWNELNQPFATEETQTPPHDPVAGDIYGLFTSDLGRRVMSHLEKYAFVSPSWPPQAADGMAIGMFLAMREGEGNLVRWIQRQMVKGEKQLKPVENRSNDV